MDLPLTDPRPVGRIIADQAQRFGDKPFLLFEDEVISYRDIHARAQRCAAGLWAAGVRKGDKVAILLNNRPEFLVAVYGILTMGAVEVPVNTAYKGDLLTYILEHSEATAVIVEGEYLSRLLDIKHTIPNIARVWVIDGPANAPPAQWTLAPFSTLMQSSEAAPQVEVAPHDLSGIVYTSGTTGPSKGVMCTHHYFYNFASAWGAAIRLQPDDVYYTCLPYFHFAAQVGTTFTSLVRGATVVMGRRFSASEFWDDLRRYRATGATLLGSLCHILLKAPPSPRDRDHRVRFFWTAPAPAAIHGEFQERFGVKLLEGYGMTETNIPLQTPYDAPRPGSCGKPWGSFEVDVVDDNDWPVGAGVVGEIVTRPRMPWAMMAGYYRMPDKTAEAFRNLWFHTGDRGHKDEDGYFYFDDRKKDSIRRRGENISSYEIERVVDSHPAVLESAAVAVPSELSEDDVKIVVVLQKGATLSPAELIAFCAPRMAYFMVPRYVDVINELPKTPNGKVEKHKLRSAGVTAQTFDREAAGIKISRTGTQGLTSGGESERMWWHPGSKCYDDFKVGERFVSPGKTISEGDVEAFSRLTGDYNPLHTDVLAARASDYGERVCPHLLPMVIITGLFMGRLGVFDTTGLTFLALENMRFIEPVRIGDTIHVEMEVLSMRVSQSKPDFGVIVYRLEGINQHGKRFLEGEWHEWVARESWKEKNRAAFTNL